MFSNNRSVTSENSNDRREKLFKPNFICTLNWLNIFTDVPSDKFTLLISEGHFYLRTAHRPLGGKSAAWRQAMASHRQFSLASPSLKNTHTVKYSWFSRAVPRHRRLVDRPFTADFRARSQVSSCDICVGQSAQWTGFCPSNSVFSVSIFPSLPHTHRHLHVALTRRTKGRSLGTLQKQCSTWSRWEFYRKLVSFFYFLRA